MKEKIEARIQELEKQKENAIASANACAGAIMELKQLLIEEKPKE